MRLLGAERKAKVYEYGTQPRLRICGIYHNARANFTCHMHDIGEAQPDSVTNQEQLVKASR